MIVRLEKVAAYIPGSFYERELPCLLALINQLPELPSIVIVDGYVSLGTKGEDGLGGHLYRSLHGQVPVVGVAKTYFKGTPTEACVFRGKSRRPLYVTAIGMDAVQVRAGVQSMSGGNRIPDLLRKVDLLCRNEANDV